MRKALAKGLLVIIEAGIHMLATGSRIRGREIGILMEWIIFLKVVLPMIYLINPVLILLLRVLGRHSVTTSPPRTAKSTLSLARSGLTSNQHPIELSEATGGSDE